MSKYTLKPLITSFGILYQPEFVRQAVLSLDHEFFTKQTNDNSLITCIFVVLLHLLVP